MSLWRQLTGGLHVLLRRPAADRDVADELQHYLDEATAERVARGVPRDQAARDARLELGGAVQAREQIRDGGWEAVVGVTLSDLRHAWRGLRAAPGFTAVAVLTLAIGIGGTTAILGAVNPILFEPLPYPQASRVVMVLENGRRIGGTFALFREFEGRSRSFEAIAVLKPWQPTLTGADEPERFEGQRVSAGYFRVLGVAPIAGRDFEPADDRFHGPNVVILSDGLWRRRFGGDRAIVGRQIRLDDDLYTVIGVMPSGFENVLAPSAALWAPLQYDPALPAMGREWGHHLSTVGRLRPGIRVDGATREIDGLGRAVVNTLHPETYDPNTEFTVSTLHDELTRGVRPALLVILAAMTLVLAIACVNVTNLLLARGVQRQSEFALRAALGAGRGRLVRQLLTESLLLAAMGGALGAAVAMAGVRALLALSPPGLPRAGAIGIDGSVLAFGCGITTVVGLVFGVMPALRAARTDPQADLRHGSRHTPGHRRTRRALVVVEVALALVLLVSSGLLLRSMQRLFAVPAGFDPAGLLTMQVQSVGHRFSLDEARLRFFDQIRAAVRRVPGVASVAFTSQLPMSGDRDEYGAHFEASPTQPAGTYAVFRYAVSPDYLETMRVPLLRGRLLDRRDDVTAPLVALISESVANARFHGADPIGQRVRVGGSPTAPPFTIVGVVGDVKQMSLALTESGAVYHTTAQGRWVDGVVSLVVRAPHDAAALAPAVRQAVWSIDKDQPVVRVTTMDALVAGSAAERRFLLSLFEAFAFAALVLAAAGLYGVLSGSVAERTREIGVRSALGASRGDILLMVLGEGARLSALGVAIGLAGAVGASRTIASMLFGISALDPLTYVSVVALLGGVALTACGVPAWRAGRIDPATTLRAE